MNLTVEPRGYQIELQPERTVMQSALAAGYWWPTVCGGNAECGACVMRVTDGVRSLRAINAMEAAMLDSLVGRYPGAQVGEVRLACQAVPTGDVSVRKPGVRLLRADDKR